MTNLFCWQPLLIRLLMYVRQVKDENSVLYIHQPRCHPAYVHFFKIPYSPRFDDDKFLVQNFDNFYDLISLILYFDN